MKGKSTRPEIPQQAFGVMRRDTALKFLHVHNRHHLSIIADIIDSL
jgi:hypothetical protein